ncbi:MAG: hypothetical protein GX610_24915 [Rhodococcus sp.]|nr:hypothetical protein [Rhodococcus sp. (in: high G+C Gram-positive bacteria)]
MKRPIALVFGIVAVSGACGADEGTPDQQALSERGLSEVTSDMVTAGYDCSADEIDSGGLVAVLPESAQWMLLDRPPTVTEHVTVDGTPAAKMAFSGAVTRLRRVDEPNGLLSIPERASSTVEQEHVEELLVSSRLATSLDSLPDDTSVVVALDRDPMPLGRPIGTAFAVGEGERLVLLYACADSAFAATDLLANAPSNFAGTELDLITGNSPELLSKLESGPYTPPPTAPTPGGLPAGPPDTP